MFEFILLVYGIGAAFTAVSCIGAVMRDHDLSNFEKAAYPIFGGLIWPYTWYVWIRGR